MASYARAVGVGDVDGLRSLLADDVALWADGGGKARGAATRPVIGSGNVVAFLMASRRYAAQEAANFDISEINGETSVILREYGRALVVMTFEISDRKIQVMRFVANPDKLTRI